MEPPNGLDAVGAWTEDKHALLKSYLEAYVNVLRQWKLCRGYEYIDGFAGTGSAVSRDHRRFVRGSPRIALELEHPFTKYHFIERDSRRRKRLEKAVAEYEGRDASIYPGNCNDVIINEILPHLPYNTYKRAFAFLDPWGMHLDWSTVSACAETETTEVLINFPMMDINMNVRLKHAEDVKSVHAERMTMLCGDESWRKELFHRPPTLFPMGEERVEMSAWDLGTWFGRRLKSIYKFVTPPLVMRDDKNHPLYCLLFAGNNERGAKIATWAFDKQIDPDRKRGKKGR